MGPGTPGLGGGPASFDMFGAALAALGDVDADGVTDLAVGAPTTGGPFAAYGSVWIVRLLSNGGVKTASRISAGVGGFTGTPILLGGVLPAGAGFGTALASLGDLDGDGVGDLAVGAALDQVGPTTIDTGVVWILFLDASGNVQAQQKIDALAGGFAGTLAPGDRFGSALAFLGDQDGDGVGDLAVGAPGDDDGGSSLFGRGAVWILLLNANGTVKAHQKISATGGGLTGPLAADDLFGHSLAALGDLEGDGDVAGDLAVGAPSLTGKGTVWVLHLDPAGSVVGEQRVDDTLGGFGGTLTAGDGFGSSLARIGDLSGDTLGELAVGAWGSDAGGPARGAVWLLFLDAAGAVLGEHEISATSGQLTGPLADGDAFGWSLAALGDLDGDGRDDLAVGAALDGAADAGALWNLFLHSPWQDLGSGLAGLAGVPLLAADGTLITPDPVTFTLSSARPSALAYLIVGLFQANVPFKGGVMVPHLDLPILLFTDPVGGLVLSSPWPSGLPSGLPFYTQYWIQDPAGPVGYAASNALEGTTP